MYKNSLKARWRAAGNKQPPAKPVAESKNPTLLCSRVGFLKKCFVFYCLPDREQLNATANSFRSMRHINNLKTPLQAHFFRKTDTLLKIRLKKLYFWGLSSFLYIAHFLPLWQARYGHTGERLSSLYVYFPVLQWGHSFLRNICFILPRRTFFLCFTFHIHLFFRKPCLYKAPACCLCNMLLSCQCFFCIFSY